jgi:DnaK suppressor protein
MSNVLDLPRRTALRTALLQKREALLARMAAHQGDATRVQHAQEVLSQANEDGHAADADREVDLALTDHERVELAQVGAALQRLDSDDYGVCIDCGVDIAYERLQVQPQATRCVACEGHHEGHRVETRGFAGTRPATL